MAFKEVMNAVGLLAHKAGSIITGGAFVITSVPSVKARALALGVHRGPLTYTFSGGSSPGFVDGSVATVVPQTIAPTATKTKADSLLVMRQNDFGTMNCIGTLLPAPPPPAPPTGPVSGPVEVVFAGQVKAKAQ